MHGGGGNLLPASNAIYGIEWTGNAEACEARDDKEPLEYAAIASFRSHNPDSDKRIEWVGFCFAESTFEARIVESWIMLYPSSNIITLIFHLVTR